MVESFLCRFSHFSCIHFLVTSSNASLFFHGSLYVSLSLHAVWTWRAERAGRVCYCGWTNASFSRSILFCMEQIKIFSGTFSGWSANNVSGQVKTAPSLRQSISKANMETMGEKTSWKVLTWLKFLHPCRNLGNWSENKLGPKVKSFSNCSQKTCIGCVYGCLGAWLHSAVGDFPAGQRWEERCL